MIGRMLSIMRKEFLHILRDPRTLAMMFIVPIVWMILMGYVATTDVEHLSTAVLDRDQTQQSRELVETYRASNYFDITRYVDGEGALIDLLDGGEVRAGLIIPGGYGADLTKGERPQISFLVDGSDPSVANTAYAAAQSVGQSKSLEVVQRMLGVEVDTLPGIDVRPRVLYNPEMESANYMIPASIGITLQFVTMMFTSLSIVREREQGTMEQIIVTPIKPFELVVGKVVPYVAISFWDLAEVLLIGVYWFGVPIRGSVLLLLALAFLFLFTCLGLGLLISATAHTQQEAMFLTIFMMIPTIFLSGFFFPLEAMPSALQALSYLVPLRHFLIIVRSIFLKGVGLTMFGSEVVVLCIFGPAILLLAASRFRKRLE